MDGSGTLDPPDGRTCRALQCAPKPPPKTLGVGNKALGGNLKVDLAVWRHWIPDGQLLRAELPGAHPTLRSKPSGP
jgi:hypothetical protein